MKTLASILCAAALVGCGNDSVDVDDLPDGIEDAVCDWLVKCGAIEGREHCDNLFVGELHPDLLAGIEDGTIDYDGEAAADCLGQVSGGSCNADDHEGRNVFGGPSCDDVFTGTVEDGGQCYHDEQCVSGNCAAPPDCFEACCLGACEAAPALAAVGEQCGFVGNELIECVDDAYCDGEACAPLEAEGSPCDTDSQCELGLSCYALGDAPETCQPLPGEGEPCEPQFFGGGCNSPGLVCDGDTGVCEPWLHEGDACGPDSNRCSIYYLQCDPETNTCQPLPDAGEPCADSRCRAGAYCDVATSMCVAQKADGEPCVDADECLSDECSAVDGTCGPDPGCL